MLKNRVRIKSIIALAAMVLTTTALAIGSPVKLMQGVGNNMIAGLAKHKGQLQTHPSIISNLVEKNLLPVVNLARMAGSVVGQPWRSATGAQRRAFINQFKQLVISTYSSALASYDDDVLKFYPLRGNYQRARALMVRSVIIRQNGQRISVNYYLSRAGNTWRVYDFTIENVSMVQSYRSQFASTLQSGGLNALIAQLKSHNQKG